MIAERGYHIQAEAPAWPDMPPVVFEDRSMIVSRFHSGLRAASFVEFARENSAPDPRKWERLRSHAVGARACRLPGSHVNGWAHVPHCRTICPAIGRSGLRGQSLYAFGHQHLGLTLAAVTGELISALALREPTPRSTSRRSRSIVL